jgi:hypothetical protein
VLTIFAIPKPFLGHIGIIQRNAIKSWTLLRPQPEILLFGDEEGTAEAAREFDLCHVPSVAKNEYGTPLLNDLFQQAETHASTPFLCYVNADILLTDDLIGALQAVRRSSLQKFLMIGRRWDVTIPKPLDFTLPDWRRSLRELAVRTNNRRSTEWIDYFVFTRGFGTDLPPFAIGRTCWDNWLVWHGRESGAAVVDCSNAVMAVHQNHDYAHHPEGTTGVWKGAEAAANARLSGGRRRHHTISNATRWITTDGKVKRVSFRRRLEAFMEPITAMLFDLFVHRTAFVRHRLGLRRKPIEQRRTVDEAASPVPAPGRYKIGKPVETQFTDEENRVVHEFGISVADERTGQVREVGPKLPMTCSRFSGGG